MRLEGSLELWEGAGTQALRFPRMNTAQQLDCQDLLAGGTLFTVKCFRRGAGMAAQQVKWLPTMPPSLISTGSSLGCSIFHKAPY